MLCTAGSRRKFLRLRKAKTGFCYFNESAKWRDLCSCQPSEYDLNEPFVLTEEYEAEGKTQNDKLNDMWRNPVISDSYEPGSTFKIVTAIRPLLEEKEE
ncbi:MAG: penicillin-binding transpeptidase domain-containing protein [Anaerobutyricum soehngenii]